MLTWQEALQDQLYQQPLDPQSCGQHKAPQHNGLVPATQVPAISASAILHAGPTKVVYITCGADHNTDSVQCRWCIPAPA